MFCNRRKHMRKLVVSLSLAAVLLGSLVPVSEAHAKYRREWVRDEHGRRVLVCEQWGRVYYRPGKHYAWYPVPCGR
jgi:hypothetical protein